MDLDIKLVNPPHFMVLHKLNCKNYENVGRSGDIHSVIGE